MMSGNLPTPDPAAAEQANVAAGQARQAAEAGLRDGSLSLEALFAQGDPEGPGVPHMHVRAALEALPHIGEVRAQEILDAAGVDGSHHLDQLGTDQQRTLIEHAQQFTG